MKYFIIILTFGFFSHLAHAENKPNHPIPTRGCDLATGKKCPLVMKSHGPRAEDKEFFYLDDKGQKHKVKK